jgi:predicted MFS family arabinose efflux permease
MRPSLDVPAHAPPAIRPAHVWSWRIAVGVMAFLTLVDLFATQAILPALTVIYGVSPAAMGAAVNASTFGMAAAGLAVALFGRRIPRRGGVAAALALLALPTALLAHAPDLTTFALLRIVQGVLMAAAFALTLAYLSEATDVAQTSAAFAAYVTGNVASNLFGRMIAAFVTGSAGIASNFNLFALLNLAGALLAYVLLRPTGHRRQPPAMRETAAGMMNLKRRSALVACFAIGFCILFGFIGTFTYVGFVLARAPLGLDMMSLGLVYLVFAPSLLTTPAAGRIAARFGHRVALSGGLLLALAGLPLLLTPSLVGVSAGLALVAIGTFLAQAVATGAVGRIARDQPATASGLYLASYFTGGLVGSVVLGQVFVHVGWVATVAVIAASFGLAAALTRVVARDLVE